MPSDSEQLPKAIRFGGDFELNPRAYSLRRAGLPLKLERIPLEILLLLAERPGQLVSREEIVARVWGKGHYLDTDNSINGAVRKIRQVLGDDPEQPRFIQTITGRGYCFIAPVREDGPPRLTETVSAAPAGEEPALRPRPRVGIWLALGLTMSLVVASAVAAWVLWSRSRQSAPVTSRVMLAVLPFQNLTGDPALEYLSDGLTEEMIAQLGTRDPERLGVIARTSVMMYKSDQRPLDQIERELGVQYVLEGSLRRDANQVRVTAQLIQAKDHTHLWARQYDRELKALLTLQGEIAHQIAGEILSRIGSPEAATRAQLVRSTEDYEAYDYYLKGQYFLNKRTSWDLERAIEYFRQATTRDPTYARAHASRAHAYALLPGYSARPPKEFMSVARASATKALELDEGLPEAHTAIALIVQVHDWDWQRAERGFRRAIELNPNYATAHHWYAEHLMWRGRFDEALRESDLARQLDPLSLIVATDHGAILFNARQYDRAIAQFRSVLELDPDFPRAHLISAVYVEKGMYEEALADLEAQRPKTPPHWYWHGRAWMLGRAGRMAEARHALEQFLRASQDSGLAPSLVAGILASMGDKEQALAWLQKAYGEHDGGLVSLKVAPGWDLLRNDPRFQSLVRRVGLTP